MYFGIYSITNVVTGDMYIGQTIQDFEKRWKSHISALNRGNHDNEYLQRSWNKYGEDAFKFKAIHYCDELDILNDLEKYYIKKYDTYNNGFNMTEGGDYFLNEIPEEIRKKRLENLKKVNRERSYYTEHQIAKVKEMLSVLEYKSSIIFLFLHSIKFNCLIFSFKSDLTSIQESRFLML